jgi:transposase
MSTGSRGLFFSQGIADYDPRRPDRCARLDELRTGDGRALPPRLKAVALRDLEITELLERQISAVKAERDALLAAAQTAEVPSKAVRMRLCSGAVAAYAGLAPTPWKSGQIDYEQGVSKVGNPRLSAILVEVAWHSLRHQPGSALSLWYHDLLRRLGRAEEEGHRRRAGEETACRALEVRDPRRGYWGSSPEGNPIPSAHRTLITSTKA